jgi:drug/metabolite transporter (DMT)-like permease
MWGLYTRALSMAPSSIQASIVNTSSNFIITALLGMGVFGEKLPMQWWIGAGLLISGSVVIGRREEEPKAEETKKKQ